MGKVLLAWLEPEERENFLGRHPIMPHTNRTITSAEAVTAELRRVRHRVTAIDDREEPSPSGVWRFP